MECIGKAESAFRRFSQESTIEIFVGTFGNVVYFYNHAFLQVIEAHARSWTDRDRETFAADGWNTGNSRHLIEEQAGEARVVEQVVHSHIVFVFGYHVAHGKDIASVALYVFYIST